MLVWRGTRRLIVLGLELIQHVEYFGESRPSLSLSDKEAAMTHLFWLSDDAWAAIEPHLPQGKPGKPRVDDRRVISGILHVLKTCRWRDAASGCPGGSARPRARSFLNVRPQRSRKIQSVARAAYTSRSAASLSSISLMVCPAWSRPARECHHGEDRASSGAAVPDGQLFDRRFGAPGEPSGSPSPARSETVPPPDAECSNLL